MTKAKEEVIFPEPKDIYEAMSQLMGRIGYVQKEEAKDLKYTISSEPAFIRAVRPHMVDLGITLRQVGAELLNREEFTSKSGARGINLLFQFTWIWHHGPSKTEMVVTSLGEAADYGDKGACKCMTVGLKYAMRQSLVIETGDDPDYTGSEQYERMTKEEFERVKERVSSERGMPSTDDGGGRLENQWEKEILEAAVDLNLVQAKPHAVNILNRSALFQIPFGALTKDVGIAYLIGWQKTKEADPDASTEDRQAIVEKGWANPEARSRLIEQAIELLGG